VSGDEGFAERLLCVAQTTEPTAEFENKAAGGFNRQLLLGKSAAVWNQTDQRGIGKSGHQSWTLRRSASNA